MAAELSAAAHAAGLHFGAYYSILNRQDPNASAPGINTYMTRRETQLRELITNDHPGLLWLDGEWPDWWTDERGRELTEFVRNLDPSIIINNRVGKPLSTDGDYDTPEQAIPTNEPPGRLWESAITPCRSPGMRLPGSSDPRNAQAFLCPLPLWLVA